jgi:hypothetical protein
MLTGTLHIAWDTLTIGEDAHDLEEYAAFLQQCLDRDFPGNSVRFSLEPGYAELEGTPEDLERYHRKDYWAEWLNSE